MKKITLLAGVFLITFLSYSQVKEKEIISKNSKGEPDLINFSETKINADEKSVNDFLLKQFESKKSGTSKNASKGAKSEYRVKPENNRIENNLESKKYQQFYNGIKVESGIQNVVSENGKIKITTGKHVDVSNLSTVPKLSEKEALDFALKRIGAIAYVWDNTQNENLKKAEYPKGELLIIEKNLDGENLIAVLAYKFDINAVNPMSRNYLYIDALTGEVLLIDPIIKDIQGPAATRYSGQKMIETQSYGGQYRLRDYSKGNGIETYNLNKGNATSQATEFTDNDNNWTAAEYNNLNKDNAALDVHWGVEMTYDYFVAKHNYSSYDGKGSVVRNYVHYGNFSDNAFWDRVDKTLSFGDGYVEYGPLTSLDIVGHEFAHGICSTWPQLDSNKEPGAIDESLSDIWGAMVEYYADPSKQTYLCAEESHLSGPARSMSNPKSRFQPDTYQGLYWYDLTGCVPIPNSLPNGNDNCGVHRNSGVMNHWFYILAEGKAGTNDKGYEYNMFGIGKEKAAKIVFRAETVYFRAGTNYLMARDLTIQAAKDLFGEDSTEAKTVCMAWAAVGVGYGNCGKVPSKVLGPDYICATSNYQFNFVNPDNINVSWSVSSNLQIINQTNTSVTVSAVNASVNAFASVTVNVNGLISTRDIWIGKPYSYYTYDRVEYCNYNYRAKDFPDTVQGTTFSWQFVSATGNASASNFYTNGDFVQFTACPPFSIVMKLTSTNSCGTTEQFVEQHLNNDDEEIDFTGQINYKYLVYPNPAKDIVNIELVDQNDQSNKEITIFGELFDLLGQSKSKVEIKDNKATISVKNLDRGVYVLRININNKFESHQIIVE